MRRVANGHPSALVMERCQPGSRFTWGGVPERGNIPADCMHTRIRTHNSPWDQLLTRHTSLFCFIQALSVSLSLCLFLACLLHLARLPDFALSVLLAMFSVSLLTLCFVFYTLYLSRFVSLSLSLSAVVWVCVFVLCQCFESHWSDGISGVSPQLCAIISFCSIQHISEASAPSGKHKQKHVKLTLALPIVIMANEMCLTVWKW